MQFYLITILLALAAAPVTYGYMTLKTVGIRAASFEEGRSAGLSQGRTAGLAEASKTKQALAEAEAKTPLVVDKTEVIKLCLNSDSCTDRAKLMAAKPRPDAKGKK